MKQTNLLIAEVPITSLNPAPYNPRYWDKTARENLKESITRFGLVDPIIANFAEARKNIVIGGHFRLEMAKELGYTKVPVLYLNIPDIEKEKELNLRLNKNTGDWQYDLLKEFDTEFLLDIGFGDSDLSHIWDADLEIEDDEFNLEKEIEKIKIPKTQSGDLYQLGSHRLLCGDSTDLSNVERLAGKQTSQMILCDPPYNINYSYESGFGTNKKYGSTMTNDNKTQDEYRTFLKQTMENALAVSDIDTHVFYYCDESFIWLIQTLFAELGLTNRRVCLWLKNNQNPTPQIAFNKAYEPCIYSTRGKPYLSEKVKNLNEVLNKEVGTGNRLTDDVMDLFNIWLVKRIAGTEYIHPTEKNPALHEKALRRCTKPGDVVLDLFAGSGSTLIACEQMKRTCLTIEQEPLFCDVIINRYEKLTGNKVKKIN